MSDRAPYGLDGLEQSCVEPGHWLIEGRNVTRARTYGRHGLTYWQIRHFGDLVASRATLQECREYIADEIEHGER